MDTNNSIVEKAKSFALVYINETIIPQMQSDMRTLEGKRKWRNLTYNSNVAEQICKMAGVNPNEYNFAVFEFTFALIQQAKKDIKNQIHTSPINAF